MKYNLEWWDEGAIEVCKLKEEFFLTTTTQVDNLSKLSQTSMHDFTSLALFTTSARELQIK